MSRMPSGSSAAMQVAAQPSNNIYTLLTLIALVFLLFTVIFAMIEADSRFGWFVPFAGQYEEAKQKNKNDMAAIAKTIRETEDALKKVTLKNPESEEGATAP